MVHDWHPCFPDRFIQHAAEEQRTGHGPDSWNLSVNHSMNSLNTPGCSWVIKAVKMSKCVKSLLKTFLSRKAANSSTGTSIKKIQYQPAPFICLLQTPPMLPRKQGRGGKAAEQEAALSCPGAAGHIAASALQRGTPTPASSRRDSQLEAPTAHSARAERDTSQKL